MQAEKTLEERGQVKEFRGFCSFFRGRVVETVLHLPAFTVLHNSGLTQHGVSESFRVTTSVCPSIFSSNNSKEVCDENG